MDLIQLVRQQSREDINRSAVGVFPWRATTLPPSHASRAHCAFCLAPIETQALCYCVSRLDGINGVGVLALPRMDGGWRYAPAWSCEECGKMFVFWKE
jgi:hypothetical protein